MAGCGVRYPALQGKRDANEPGIIAALEAEGATVFPNPIGQGKPDLTVGFNKINTLMEVKTPSGRLNKKQVEWHSSWAGQVCVVRTPSEALSAIGLDADLDDKCRSAWL